MSRALIETRTGIAGWWLDISSVVLLLVVAASCNRPAAVDESGVGPVPPLRIDLTEQLPVIETADGREADAPVVLASREEATRADDFQTAVVLDFAMGAGLPNPRREERGDLRLVTKARTIKHHADVRLAWRVAITSGAQLTFRPAVPTDPGCIATYRLKLRHEQEEQAIFERTVTGPPLWAWEEESIDLSSWSGQTLELVADGALDAAVPGSTACVGQSLGWMSPAIWSPARKKSKPRRGPGVILVGLDTVRADHLGAWGMSPSPTPHLDALAAESDVFLNTYSAFNVTNPSFISIFTGLYGKNHGVYELDVPVSREAVTLAELYKARGYATQAVLAATHLHDRASGLGQGFDGVHVPWGQFAAEEVVRRGLHWLANLEKIGMPFFLWLHFFDAHTPHLPPLPYATGRVPAKVGGLAPVREWQSLRPEGLLQHVDPKFGAHPDLYPDGLAYLDRQLGRLLEALDRRGFLETTWIVVVSDHGENLTEHGLVCRHTGLWDTTTHVPLMVRPPGPRGQEGRRFEQMVQSIDLFPTILQATGIEPPPSDGEDLYSLVASGGREAVYAEHAHEAGAMMRTRDYLYYRQSKDADIVEAGIRFYDLATDPHQERNLAGTGSPAEADLAARLDAWLHERRSRSLAAAATGLGEDEASQLEALGYIDP